MKIDDALRHAIARLSDVPAANTIQAMDDVNAAEALHGLLAQGDTTMTDAIPTGRRNTTLANYARDMFARGLDAATVYENAIHLNRERCEPPLPIPEVEKIVRGLAAKRGAPTAHPIGHPENPLRVGEFEYVQDAAGRWWHRNSLGGRNLVLEEHTLLTELREARAAIHKALAYMDGGEPTWPVLVQATLRSAVRGVQR